MPPKEKLERLFYGLDEKKLEQIVREVMAEDLSVVQDGILDRFEEATASFFGARHAVAACNGTAALHLALFALNIQPGDEVLIPAYGYYAMALPVCMLGATPVFCDVLENDFTLNLGEAEAMVTSRTRAVVVHQPWGCPADAAALRQFADRHGLGLISDSSHAHGAFWNGRPLGHYYDFVCTSFGKGKLISGGELGVATANEDRFRDRMLLYGHVNRVPQALLTAEYRHMHNAVGIKYRPHPFAMALALDQLQTYSERSRKLVENARRFEQGVSQLAGFGTFPAPEPASRVYWRVPVQVLDTARLGSLPSLLEMLQVSGCPVEHRRGLVIPEHNALTEFYGVNTRRNFPVAERLQSQTLLVNAFALYQPESVEKALAQFSSVAQSSF